MRPKIKIICPTRITHHTLEWPSKPPPPPHTQSSLNHKVCTFANIFPWGPHIQLNKTRYKEKDGFFLPQHRFWYGVGLGMHPSFARRQDEGRRGNGVARLLLRPLSWGLLRHCGGRPVPAHVAYVLPPLCRTCLRQGGWGDGLACGRRPSKAHEAQQMLSLRIGLQTDRLGRGGRGGVPGIAGEDCGRLKVIKDGTMKREGRWRHGHVGRSARGKNVARAKPFSEGVCFKYSHSRQIRRSRLDFYASYMSNSRIWLCVVMFCLICFVNCISFC